MKFLRNKQVVLFILSILIHLSLYSYTYADKEAKENTQITSQAVNNKNSQEIGDAIFRDLDGILAQFINDHAGIYIKYDGGKFSKGLKK
ncbi:MAG: hypothetical protein QMD92_07645 [bacterium]|nr:hypothetical protein [bacterium]